MARKKKSQIRGRADKRALQGQSERLQDKRSDTLSFNFGDFDDTQKGQSFKEWSESGLLLKAIHQWKELSKKTPVECLNLGEVFKIYGNFPNASRFHHPQHVTRDAKWARISLQGKERVIGHVIGSVFYVIFFDEDHCFYPTKKKHT